MNHLFFIILLVVLFVIYILINKSNVFFTQENFYICPCKYRKSNKYSYNPPINTPQSNYKNIFNNINSQQTYKKDLSVALSPTPTIHCTELNNKTDCNSFGCNWFGSSDEKNSNSFCSSTYPTQL